MKAIDPTCLPTKRGEKTNSYTLVDSGCTEKEESPCKPIPFIMTSNKEVALRGFESSILN